MEDYRLKSAITLIKTQSIFSIPEQTDSSTVFLSSEHFQNMLEEDIQRKTGKCLLHPTDKFKKGWDMVLAILLIYTATVMPYNMAFIETPQWSAQFFVDLSIDILFFIDIVVNFNSAFTNSDGEYVTSRAKIAISYAKSWLIIDIIACIPFNFFDSESSAPKDDYNNLLRLLRLPRLYRLMRISRLFKMMKHYQNCEFILKIQDYLNIRYSTMRVIKSVLTISLCLHLMACIWAFAARLENYHPDTWVSRYGLDKDDIGNLYLTSLYWALTTLSSVGYGDISPYTNIEKLLANVWILFCVIFISFNVSNMTSIINASASKDTILSYKLAGMDEFAKENNLNRKLQLELRHALRYSDKKLGYSWHEKLRIFNELPKKLRFKVALAMHRGSIEKIAFFKGKDLAFIADIVPFLVPMMVKGKDKVYRVGDYAEEIYFVVTGKIGYSFDGSIFRTVAAGGYFGDIEVMNDLYRKYDTQAKSSSELLAMRRTLIAKIHADYFEVWKKMHEAAEERDLLNKAALVRMVEWKTKSKNQEKNTIDSLKMNSQSLSPTRMNSETKPKEKKQRFDKSTLGIYETYRRCCQHLWILKSNLKSISEETKSMLKYSKRRSSLFTHKTSF